MQSDQHSEMIGREAAIPNPKLRAFQPLIGTWKTVGHHPMIPEKTFHGRTSFAWQDGGAFLVMRSEVDEPEVPSGIAIISGDDSSDVLTMLYFDQRSVSRRYEIKMEGNAATWWRNSPEISQRCTITVSDDGNSMQTKGEFSKDNGPWGQDLEQTFTRIA